MKLRDIIQGIIEKFPDHSIMDLSSNGMKTFLFIYFISFTYFFFIIINIQ